MKKYILALAISITVFSFVYYETHKISLGGMSSLSSYPCTVSNATAVTVGNQLSSTILAANSRRAWAKIQGFGTSTTYLAFATGTAATVGNGLALGQLNATTTDTNIVFGLNTDFPYTGAVTGITNMGSTTVLVTACNY